jgi:hypothetical protein
MHKSTPGAKEVTPVNKEVTSPTIEVTPQDGEKGNGGEGEQGEAEGEGEQGEAKLGEAGKGEKEQGEVEEEEGEAEEGEEESEEGEGEAEREEEQGTSKPKVPKKGRSKRKRKEASKKSKKDAQEDSEEEVEVIEVHEEENEPGVESTGVSRRTKMTTPLRYDFFKVDVTSPGYVADVVARFKRWCKRLSMHGLRPGGWTSGSGSGQSKYGADLIILQMGAGVATTQSLGKVPDWSMFRGDMLDEVEVAAKSYLSEEGTIALIHSGSLEHSSCVWDSFFYEGSPWMLRESFFVWNETRCYNPHSGKTVSSFFQFLLNNIGWLSTV